ncbi:ABC transporter permease subunit [Halobacillus sp. MO56]
MAYLWKEGLEQARGMGLWIGLGLVMLTSIFLIAEARTYPDELAFEALLLSLYDINIYLLPLFALFIASFAVFQEKELKTLMILLTKRESHLSFLVKKSFAIQFVVLAAFVLGYFVLALFMKAFLSFQITSFLTFLFIIVIFLLIFNQLGILLGTVCKSKMQLVGANVLVWFVTVFLLDLMFLYFLPAVSYDNVQVFSWFYFLNPIHAMRFYLETSLGLFSMDHLSRLLNEMIFMDVRYFLLINVITWPGLFFLLSTKFRHGGELRD